MTVSTPPAHPLSLDMIDPLERLTALADGREPAPANQIKALQCDGLRRVQDRLSLSAFETGVLLLSLAVSISPDAAEVCAALCNRTEDPRISFRLADLAYPGGEYADITPQSRLLTWRLVEPEPAHTLLDAPLTLSEFVLHKACGADSRDRALLSRLHPIETHAAPDHPIASQIASQWKSSDFTPIILSGSHSGMRQDVARNAAYQRSLALDRLYAGDIPLQAEERAVLMAQLGRDGLVYDRMVLIDVLNPDDPGLVQQLDGLRQIPGPVLISTGTPITGLNGNWARVMVTPHSKQSRNQIWRNILGSTTKTPLPNTITDMDIDIDRAQGIARRARMLSAKTPVSDTCLMEAARDSDRAALERFADRIDVRHDLKSLVFSDDVSAQLDALIQTGVHRRRVFEDWGFQPSSTRGQGIAALFSGPSGVGKTSAAEAISRALNQDLYRIDLSRVVSKYIGETEERLSRVFTAAEHAGVQLLFDEGEALFGKRTEVRDGRDRYANQEVSYLLQRMEQFEGIAILTTNQRDGVDEAFLRRFSFAIEFAPPGPDERERIWRSIFPTNAPVAALDYKALGDLSLTGGHIRNAAFNALVQASIRNGQVEMADIQSALALEYRKLGKAIPTALKAH